MQLSKKVVLTIKAIKKIRSYKTIIKAILVYRRDGLIGLKKAILNKAIEDTVLELNNNKRLMEEDDKFGNRILMKQQEEIDIELFNNNINSWNKKPLISVVMPIYNPPIKWLKIAIESLQNQIYSNWELCAVDDGSTSLDGIKEIEEYAKKDKRIRFYKSKRNRGISKASNKAIEMANGEYIALLDQDDELLPDSFYWFVDAINKKPEADFLYSDECKIKEDNSKKGFEFLFKADWDPYLLINNMFIGHLVMYKTDLLKIYGGFNSDFDFGQDYELAMRMGDYANCIVHIPRILYFWRALPTSTASGGKTFSNKVNMAVPCKWLKKKGIYSNIRKNMHYNYPIVIGNSKLVSIIEAPITMNSFKNSIEDIINNTGYKNYEIIIVAEKNILLEIEKKYPYFTNIYFIEVSEDTSILERFNMASSYANGEFLVFMNSGCIPVNKEWLDRLVDVLQFPGIGAASPVILDDKKIIKWAGSAICFDDDFNITSSPYKGHKFYDNYQRYLLSPQVSKECLSLSRDCIAITKNLFNNIGKFDINNVSLISFNEDISFKIQENKLKCAYTANAQCICADNFIEHNNIRKDEYLYVLNKWSKYYNYDPFFSTMMLKQMVCNENTDLLKFYLSSNLDFKNKKRILVFSHELSRTGGSIVVLDAVKELVSEGYYVLVVSPFDGDLRNEYEMLNVSVIIDHRLAWTRGEKEEKSLFKINWYMDNLVREFDFLFVGTLMGHNLIVRYQNYDIPTIWWIHEGSYSLDFIHKVLPKNLNKNVHVLCGGKYVQDMLKKYNIHYESEILLYGVKDIVKEYQHKIDCYEKIRFLIAGTIDERKGQDIVLSAIKRLPKEILNKVEFIFVGARSFGNVYDKLMREKNNYKNVKVLKTVTREELFALYNSIDCLLCASRDDPMPVVATEAMMLFKPCLCSNATGTSRYIVDKENGFIFESENVAQLIEKIIYIVKNKSNLSKVGLESRKIYEENFSMDKFSSSLKSVIESIKR